MTDGTTDGAAGSAGVAPIVAGQALLAGVVAAQQATAATAAAGLPAQRSIQREGRDAARTAMHASVAAMDVVLPGEGESTAAHETIETQFAVADAAASDVWDAYAELVDESVTAYREVTDEQVDAMEAAMAELTERGDGTAAGDETTGPDGDATDHSLQDIDGIGPAYADRLGTVGIDSVAALAAADPSLGEEIDTPAAHVADWIEQARKLVEE